jgi:uncharacterized SAM-binding protein YcdF (DUF218 family)
VLSTGRVQPPGDPTVSEWTDADRFYGGVDLFKARKAPLLIFTGGWLPWQPDAKPEGEVLMQYAMDLGIPESSMLVTERVMNTEEEAGAVLSLLRSRLRSQMRPRVLLVTSAFHMRRAQLQFQRAGVETIAFPVDFKVPKGLRFTLLGLVPGGASLAQSENAIREFYGLAFYALLRSS